MKQPDLGEATVYVMASKNHYPMMPQGLHPVQCGKCGAEGWGRDVPPHVATLCSICAAVFTLYLGKTEPMGVKVVALKDIIKD